MEVPAASALAREVVVWFRANRRRVDESTGSVDFPLFWEPSESTYLWICVLARIGLSRDRGSVSDSRIRRLRRQGRVMLVLRSPRFAGDAWIAVRLRGS